MRSHFRTAVVLLLVVVLLSLFLRQVDFAGVVASMMRVHPAWLLASLGTMFLTLALRAWRWQYLLGPLGQASFRNSFRATAVGFAARSVLPAAAGELVRPYFLSRCEPVSATGAFATIILERLLDLVTMLMLLASYLFVFGEPIGAANPVAFAAIKWTGGIAAAGSLVALALLFLLAGNPAGVSRTLTRLARALPSSFAAMLARVAEKFVIGLGVIRRPGRLAIAVVLSFPLWLSIAAGIWTVAVAFDLTIPFTGTFLLIALLTLGVAVPTPGAVGGFHEAFRVGATVFFGAANDVAVGSAIVLHALSVGPYLLLGLFFAAQEGLSMAGMRQLAESPQPDRAGV